MEKTKNGKRKNTIWSVQETQKEYCEQYDIVMQNKSKERNRIPIQSSSK